MSQKRKKTTNNARGGKRAGTQTARPVSGAERTVRAATAVQEPSQGIRRAAAQTATAVRESPKTPRRTTQAAASRETRGKSRRPASQQRSSADTANILTIFCRRIFRRAKRTRRRLRHLVREEQVRSFPESDNLLIRLLFLLWKMLPVWGGLLRERTWGRRKQFFHWLSSLVTRRERRRAPAILLMGAGCALAAVALFFHTYTMGTTVTYDGEVIATVPSESLVETARENLELATTRTLGETFTIDDSLLQYSSSLMRRQEIGDGETLEEDLSEEIGLVTPAYCLYVEGEFIGATPYEGALEELLKQLETSVTSENTISCSFAEEVEIRQEYIPSADIVNLGYIAETLYSTKTAEVTYEVKKGDTWSEIARDNDLTSNQLLELNPGYDIDKLQIGEVLTLSASVPYLTMTVVQQERYVDEVNYDIKYTESADMWQGDYKVTSPGQYGAADVVANVTYINGQEVERTILSSVTLREPVTEEQVRGTKVRPTWHPTGSFRWPTSGRITSSFGGRKSPGGIGSTNHKGIDIANSYGTGIYAADGGTVVRAGWQGGYGYTVQIDHGNGFVTLYAHNSSLLVSSGDKVYKGQQIARMGSTGNSTGNHCHFEVRYRGTPQNPMNYL